MSTQASEATRKLTHKADSILYCDGNLAGLGARGKLHTERRALAYRRFDPDAPAVHLNDLLGDGEAEAGASLGLGKGAVDLVELLKDPRPLVLGNTWPRIGHCDAEVTVDRLGSYTHLTSVGELDGIADEVEQHLRETLLIAEAYR